MAQIRINYTDGRNRECTDYFNPSLEERGKAERRIRQLHKQHKEAVAWHGDEKIGGVEQDTNGRWHWHIWGGELS